MAGTDDNHKPQTAPEGGAATLSAPANAVGGLFNWSTKQLSTGFNKLNDNVSKAVHNVVNETYIAVARENPELALQEFEKQNPSWKNALAEIKQDPQLTKSLHNVIKKDATMIRGLVDMSKAEGGNFDPNELSTYLREPRNRKALGMVFDKIAESEKLKFGDFKELYDNRHDQTKTLAKLNGMGISGMSLMDGGDMLKMLKEFLQNPMEFLNKLPEMMGMGPLQAEGLRNNGLFKFATHTAEMVLGGRDGYGTPLAKGIGALENYVNSGNATRDFDILSGKADERAAIAKKALENPENKVEPSGNREGSKPTTWKTTADNTNDLVNGGRIKAASLSEGFNPNSSGASLAGYTPPTAPVADNSDFRVQPARFGIAGPAAIAP